jgi:hypothetical protein
MFKGDDNIDQLKKIAAVTGTEDIVRYVKTYKLNIDGSLRSWLENVRMGKRRL